MGFEEFSTKLQACVEIFMDFDRPKQNQDIVDELWPLIQYQKLTSYVDVLNISRQNPPTD